MSRSGELRSCHSAEPTATLGPSSHCTFRGHRGHSQCPTHVRGAPQATRALLTPHPTPQTTTARRPPGNPPVSGHKDADVPGDTGQGCWGPEPASELLTPLKSVSAPSTRKENRVNKGQEREKGEEGEDGHRSLRGAWLEQRPARRTASLVTTDAAAVPLPTRTRRSTSKSEACITGLTHR